MANCKKIAKIEVINVIKEPVYDIQLEKNHYFSANGIITHNCRLRNSMVTKEFSFTNGNLGVMTGSKSVITLNLNRIIQNVSKLDRNTLFGEDDFINSFHEYLRSILHRVYKYHEAYNNVLWDEYKAGLLPAYSTHFIELDKQYLTIGINGLNEAWMFFSGRPCKPSKDYEKFCTDLFSLIKEENQKHKTKHLMFNTEMVPAESLAIKNYNWDKEDGYELPTDPEQFDINQTSGLYASYMFLPNDKSINILDKIHLHGKEYIGEYLDGGAACHLNLAEHLSKEQAMTILRWAAQEGCAYFTFNVPNTECNACGHITKKPVLQCPDCGSFNISSWDRIIGYLTKIENWSDGRQKEQKTRIYSQPKAQHIK